MADQDKEQKTEEPTEKRRQDSFQKGRTAKSMEINSTVVLFVALTMLYATGGWMREKIMEIMTTGFTQSGTFQLSVSSFRPLMFYYIKMAALIVAPIMGAIAVVSIAAIMAQNGGFILTLEPLKPKFSKLNPIKGFGRFFSKVALMELFKSLVKIGAVSYICYRVILSEWESIPMLSDQGVEQIIWFITWVGIKLGYYVLGLMLILSVIDFIFQKYTFTESLRMSKQEVKDERKETDGDPIVKQRIRTTQMAMAKRRMMAEVPKAEVVITNPTHLSVALAYNRGKMSAPTVVAKGAGHVALKIRAVAKEHDIPIVEDKPLARILFKTIDIGRSIPEELYRAIAEIMAYVYKLKGKVLENK